MTRNDDELTKLRQAFAAPLEDEPAGCPEPDQIWGAMRGELPPDEIREIVDHVAICSSCAEDWRIAMAFQEAAVEPLVVPSNVIRPPVSRFRHWKAATAAMAATLVLTVAGIQMQMSLKKPSFRSAKNGSAVETVETVEAIATPSAPRDSFVLAWKPAAEAESYELVVTTSELAIVANPKDLTATEYQVPASALAGLPKGASLSWQVYAVFPDGSRKQSTSIFTMLE